MNIILSEQASKNFKLTLALSEDLDRQENMFGEYLGSRGPYELHRTLGAVQTRPDQTKVPRDQFVS